MRKIAEAAFAVAVITAACGQAETYERSPSDPTPETSAAHRGSDETAISAPGKPYDTVPATTPAVPTSSAPTLTPESVSAPDTIPGPHSADGIDLLLNSQAENVILPALGELGLTLAGITPATEEEPYVTIVVTSDGKCGSGHVVREDPQNPGRTLTGMNFLGFMDDITDRAKLDGPEMFDDTIAHAEGAHTEEVSLEDAPGHMATVNDEACGYFYERLQNDEKNKTKKPPGRDRR